MRYTQTAEQCQTGLSPAITLTRTEHPNTRCLSENRIRCCENEWVLQLNKFASTHEILLLLLIRRWTE